MAKVSCPECNKKVSEYCKACPGCGYPIQENIEKIKSKEKERQKERQKFIGISALIAFVIFFVIIISNFKQDRKQVTSLSDILYSKTTLNVRIAPGTNSRKIDILPSFQKVKIKKIENNWAYIIYKKLNGEQKEGWVNNRYLISKNEKLTLVKKNRSKKQNISPYISPCIKKCYTELHIKSMNMSEFDTWVEFVSRKAALETKEPNFYDTCIALGGLLGVALTNSQINDNQRNKVAYKFCQACYCLE